MYKAAPQARTCFSENWRLHLRSEGNFIPDIDGASAKKKPKHFLNVLLHFN